ncbi:unnamed protein product [Closterium sp. NIES-53]
MRWCSGSGALVPLFAILPRTSSPPVLFPVVFLGFPPDTPGWQFYHPTSRRVLPSQDVTFEELVPFYRPPPADPLPPQGPAPSGVSQVDPLPLAVPVEVAVDSGAARGAASRGVASGGAASEGVVSGGAEPASAEPGGAEPEGAEPGGTKPVGAERGGAESKGAESGGAEPRGTASTGGPVGALPQLSHRREPLSPQQLREWCAQRTHVRSGAAGARGSAAGGTGAGGVGAAGPVGARTSGPGAAGVGGVGGAGAGDPGAGGTGAGDPGAGGTGAGVTAGARGPGGAGAAGPGGVRTSGTGTAGACGVGGATAGGTGAGGAGASSLGGVGVTAGAGGPGGAGAAGPGGARTRGTGAAGAGGVGGAGAADPGAGGSGAGGAGAGGPGAGGIVQWHPFFVPPQPSSLPPPDSPNSPLRAPSPYAEQIHSLTQRPEPESCRASSVRAVRTGRRVPRPRPPHLTSTHIMALRASSVPLRVPLPSPPLSSLPGVLDPESDLARATSPSVPRLLATLVSDPSFESTAASTLVAELVDFAAACRLDYATSLVAEFESVCPLSIEGECALGTDVLEDKQEDFECLAAVVPHLVAMLLAPEGDPYAPDIPTPRCYAEAITIPYSSQWQTTMDAEMESWKSTGNYIDPIPPSGANIVDGMWIFRVKRPPGSPPVFKARYVARGFTQRQGVDFFHTFSPTPKMTTLRVMLHVAAQCVYELHSLNFSTAFLQGSLHDEIWLRRPPGFIGLFLAGTQWSLRWPVYGLRQAPREWHDTLRTTLAAFGFAPSTAHPSLFLRTNTSLYLGLQITQDRARRTITLT